MTNQDNFPVDPADLRQKAEALARERGARTPEDSAELSPEEIRKTLHDLRVYQIELEMQNEELRTAQEVIEAVRARYYDLYDLAPVGYCTLSEQGLILEANLTAATLLGTTRGALVKQPISSFIYKDDQDIYYLHRMKLFEAVDFQECELRLVKPDGVFFWAHLTATTAQEDDGAPVCRLVISDITERKQAEKYLRKSEKLLSQVQKIAHIGSWELELNGSGLTWSDETYRIFGCEPQELTVTYEAFLDSVHPDDRAAVDEEYFRSLQEGIDGYELEHRIVRRQSGETRYVHERCVHERDNTGAIIRSIGMVQDITDLKQQERHRLDHLKRQRDTLVREVQHRIKNHLQGVLGLMHNSTAGQPDLAALMEPVIRRVKSIADVYGINATNCGTAITVSELIGRIICSYPEQDQIEFFPQSDTKTLILHTEEAVPASLIINELLNNAVKHRLRTLPTRPVKLTLSRSEELTCLTIASGPAYLPAGFNIDDWSCLGTGLELVKTLMSSQGSRLEFEQQGDEVVITYCFLADSQRQDLQGGDQPQIYEDLKLYRHGHRKDGATA